MVKLEDGFFPCTSSPARNAHTPSHSNMCKGPSALAPFGAAALLQTAATFLEEKQTAVRTLVKESGDAITTPTTKRKAAFVQVRKCVKWFSLDCCGIPYRRTE